MWSLLKSQFKWITILGLTNFIFGLEGAVIALTVGPWFSSTFGLLSGPAALALAVVVVAGMVTSSLILARWIVGNAFDQ